MQSMKKKEPIFPFCWKDLFITMFIFGAFTLLAFAVMPFDSGTCAPMLFILAVFLVSRYTTGYLFGTVTSLIAVFFVNYVFTYPYFAFNFTITGYPLTFISMLAISIMTSTQTTHIKKQEKLRAEAEKEKMRGNLLRAVSHDLRTPLTSILGATSALLDNEGMISKEQERALLQEAHDDAEWLIRMVENLLSVTRMNARETKIKKTAEVAEEIVGEAVRKFQKRFPTAKITVSVPDELLFVPMDPILIEQVLVNLLENAVLHGKNMTGIEITVTNATEDAVFFVRDHGVGIPESAMEHLFDGILSSGAERESDSKRNMGIGLSVCKSIVKAHGGKMTAENCPTGGAQFRFTLPLEEDHHVE